MTISHTEPAISEYLVCSPQKMVAVAPRLAWDMGAMYDQMPVWVLYASTVREQFHESVPPMA